MLESSIKKEFIYHIDIQQFNILLTSGLFYRTISFTALFRLIFSFNPPTPIKDSYFHHLPVIQQVLREAFTSQHINK